MIDVELDRLHSIIYGPVTVGGGWCPIPQVFDEKLENVAVFSDAPISWHTTWLPKNV